MLINILRSLNKWLMIMENMAMNMVTTVIMDRKGMDKRNLFKKNLLNQSLSQKKRPGMLQKINLMANNLKLKLLN
jgi:hypothetical protein